jgi:hypothetical protein
MTPQEEQAAMQAYVRQRLAAQGQLNLTPGQQPIEDPNALLQSQRLPLAPGVGPPPLSGAENSEIARDAAPGAVYSIAQGGVPPIGGPPDPLGGTPPPTFGIQNDVSSQRLQGAGRALRQALPGSQFMYRKMVPF